MKVCNVADLHPLGGVECGKKVKNGSKSISVII